jgi:outer membrane protein assembly factor BamA
VLLRDLEDSRERLSETRVFRSVDVRLDPTSRAGVRDVVIDAVERNGLDVEYSLRYTAGGNSQAGETPSDAQPGLQVGAGVEAVNPFGLAHRYRLYGLIGAERRVIGARHESASFFGLRLATQLSVFDDTDRVRDSPQFADRVTGTTFQQTRRWRLPEGRRFQDRLRMQWGYSFKHIEYTDLVTGETLGGLRAGPFYTIGGDLRDSVTDPHRGLFWSIGAELALRPLGSDVNYVRTYGQVFSFVPIGPRVVWAQAFRAGFVPGDDPQLLLENRFVAGGSSTVRGFSENALGPHGPEGAALGGQAVAIFNQELRFPVWNRLFGGVFYDAGNVFTLARDFDVSALRHSAGAGLRVMFPFGPVRVDWAHVIKPREGEKKARVIFSIGHVF